MKSGLSGRLVLDASALVELLSPTHEGHRLMQALLNEEVGAYITEIAETELRYLLCRRLGREKAERAVLALMASEYLQVEDTSDILEDAALYKCERAISLADCFCLALAKRLACPALFAREEEDLRREMARKPFDVNIIFLAAEDNERTAGEVGKA
jgi:predicted nucleic acid-binding protein